MGSAHVDRHMVRIVWNKDFLGSAKRVVKDNIGMAHGVVIIPLIEIIAGYESAQNGESLLLSEWVFRLGVGVSGALSTMT